MLQPLVYGHMDKAAHHPGYVSIHYFHILDNQGAQLACHWWSPYHKFVFHRLNLFK